MDEMSLQLSSDGESSNDTFCLKYESDGDSMCPSSDEVSRSSSMSKSPVPTYFAKELKVMLQRCDNIIMTFKETRETLQKLEEKSTKVTKHKPERHFRRKQLKKSDPSSQSNVKTVKLSEKDKYLFMLMMEGVSFEDDYKDKFFEEENKHEKVLMWSQW